MNRFFCGFMACFFGGYLFAQDTATYKAVSGFVFIPAFHSFYDKGYVGEMRPGYEDFFIPLNSPSIINLRDSNVEFLFKNCIRIERNNFHNNLKKQATQLTVIDTISATSWYGLGTFYIVPVIIDYKVIKDDFPKMMSQDSFILQIKGGSKITFVPKNTPNREVMLPIKITVLPEVIKQKKK